MMRILREWVSIDFAGSATGTADLLNVSLDTDLDSILGKARRTGSPHLIGHLTV